MKKYEQIAPNSNSRLMNASEMSKRTILKKNERKTHIKTKEAEEKGINVNNRRNKINKIPQRHDIEKGKDTFPCLIRWQRVFYVI